MMPELGPRRVPRGRIPHGVYLMGVYLIGVHLMGVYFINGHLTGVLPHRCVPYGRVPRESWVCTS
jgi:hypothetical protein